MKKQLFYLIGMILIIYIIPLYITFNFTWFIDTSGGRFIAVLAVIYLFVVYLKSISKPNINL